VITLYSAQLEVWGTRSCEGHGGPRDGSVSSSHSQPHYNTAVYVFYKQYMTKLHYNVYNACVYVLPSLQHRLVPSWYHLSRARSCVRGTLVVTTRVELGASILNLCLYWMKLANSSFGVGLSVQQFTVSGAYDGCIDLEVSHDQFLA